MIYLRPKSRWVFGNVVFAKLLWANCDSGEPIENHKQTFICWFPLVLLELLSLYNIKAKRMQPPMSERGTAPRFYFTQGPFSMMKQPGTRGGKAEATVQYLEWFQCLCLN